MSATPRWPRPVVFEGKNLVDGWEVDCMVADLFGRPRPEKPQKTELLTALEVAKRLKCARSTVTRRLREARQAAAAESAEAPDRAA